MRQCTNLKSHSSGGVPHRPGRNVDSERGQVHLGFASVYLPPSSSTLRWSCTRQSTADSSALLIRQEVKYNSAAPRCTCLLLINNALKLYSVSSTDSNAMLIRRKDKYTSAAPRCTCLPPHQHCTEVALGGKQVHLGCASMYLLSSLCNFSSSPPRPSPGTTRLRLVVPGLGLGGLEWSLCWPPRTTSVQVHRGQVQVQLGFASLNLDLALVDLRGVGSGLPRATSSSGSSGQVQVQLGFASLDLDLT